MFGRKRKFDRSLRERGVPPEQETAREADEVTTTGPYDITDAPELSGTVLDFGALKVPMRPGFEVRLEMNAKGELSGVSLIRPGSIMQLGVFAAPRSGGAWETIREDIVAEISKGGGTVEEAEGPFGPELRATLISPAGSQPARFLGVDGPRWFVRALIAGSAATTDEEAEDFLEVFRSLVIDRGVEPKPVREPIPLKLPAELAAQVQNATEQARARAGQAGPAQS